MSGLQAKKILVPFDYSDRCVNAVRQAAEIVPDDGEVLVAHVMIDFYPVHPMELYPEFSPEAERQRTEERMMKMLVEGKVNLDKVRFGFAIGDPGTEVTELARTEGIDLVMVPSHGRRGFKRMVLGSVAERIARLSPCPVLIVKESGDFSEG